jgi:thioester reductase-like protein
MNLLRLCHAGRPKTFAFTSSISTCMGPGHTSPTVPESPIGADPSVALSTGYAQSKYIGTTPHSHPHPFPFPVPNY